jgi:histidinol phosphatase-like enzyme
MNQRTIEMVSAAGGTIEEIFFCPHYPEGSVTEFAVSCGCRKPATGMVDKAKEKYGIAPVETLVIGDKAIDILLGHAIGARTALVLTGYGKAEMEKIKTGGLAPPDIYAKDLKEAVDFLLDGSNR